MPDATELELIAAELRTGVADSEGTQTVETVKFGVNYRFGGASGPPTSWY